MKQLILAMLLLTMATSVFCQEMTDGEITGAVGRSLGRYNDKVTTQDLYMKRAKMQFSQRLTELGPPPHIQRQMEAQEKRKQIRDKVLGKFNLQWSLETGLKRKQKEIQ